MKRKTEKTSWSVRALLSLGIPMVLIPGILFAHHLGWNPENFPALFQQSYASTIFVHTGVVKKVNDGDTFVLDNGFSVRMLGIDAPNRGSNDFQNAKTHLSSTILGKTVFLEYDRYQDDKYGRLLAWVWIECEGNPAFMPAEYMHLSSNRSRPGLTENPSGCTNGKLINEKMLQDGFARMSIYKERGELKYEERLKRVASL